MKAIFFVLCYDSFLPSNAFEFHAPLLSESSLSFYQLQKLLSSLYLLSYSFDDVSYSYLILE